MDDWNAGLMKHLGMRFVHVAPDRVVAELDITEALTTAGGAVHGGTLMALLFLFGKFGK
jgi:acyl-coenzyme A thioesterase PaaI-like protein